MTKLQARLERLADEATGQSVAPAADVVARRGRRRRQRQVTGTVVLAAAVVAAAVFVPAVRELPGRLGWVPERVPVAGQDGDRTVGDAGYWYGRIDASVFLRDGVTGQEREAVRDQLESLGVVDEVFHETSAEAFAHLREEFADDPEAVGRVDPTTMPESFRVLLDEPASFDVLVRALCPDATSDVRTCGQGVDVVTSQEERRGDVLLGNSGPDRADVSVFLTMDVSADQRRDLEERLEAIPAADGVADESPDEAARNVTREVRESGSLGETITLPSSFRVSLDRPTAEGVEAFIDAFCDSRQTGRCAPGVAMVMGHPRR